jgi:hypothetical protein
MTNAELLDWYGVLGRPMIKFIPSLSGAYADFKQALVENIPFLIGTKNAGIRHYIRCLEENIQSIPPCEHCGGEISSVADYGNFRRFCSKQCTAIGTLDQKRKTSLENHGTTHHLKSKKQQEVVKNIIQSRYGVDHVSQIKEVTDKVKNTNKEKYGNSVYFLSDDYKEKTKRTSFEKYGVGHFSSSDIVKNNKRNNNKERYGVSHPMMTDEVKDKVKKTVQDRYGVDSVFMLDSVKNKSRLTNISKLGVPYALSSPEVRDKINNTHIARYGCHYTQTEEGRERLKTTANEKYNRDFSSQRDLTDYAYQVLSSEDTLSTHYSEFESITEASDDLGIAISTYAKRLKSHNIPVKYDSMTSVGHRSLLDFLMNECGIDESLIENNRRDVLSNHKEVDIFIESKKFAIEYNGTYWHCDDFKHKNYHQEKSLCALNDSIRLLHVWEYDWADEHKREIIKNKIKSMIGLRNESVFARKTTPRIVSGSEAKIFMHNNHIQGFKPSLMHIGLFSENHNMVACMSIKKKNNHENTIDISRYATSVAVVGGFSKLLKFITRNNDWIKHIESYCSLDYGNGGLYEACGFTLEHITKPNYRYEKNNTIISRERAMKSKLPSLLQEFNPEISEVINMKNHGFRRIFDSGSMKYTLTV